MATFIKADSSHLIELSKVKHSAWLTTYRGIYDDDKLDNYDVLEHAKKFEKLLYDENVLLYCIYENEQMVGFFSYGKHLREYKDFVYYLRQLYLTSNAQGKGIGRQVFEFIRKDLKSKGVTKFFTNCNVYNLGSLKFYEKMGGVITLKECEGEDLSTHQAYIEYEV